MAVTIGKIFDRSFFKFIVVGIINTIVGLALIFSLYNAAHWDYWFSSAFSYIITSVLSFFLNKYFTFSIKAWNFFMVIAFAANIAIAYFIAYGVSKPAVNYILRNSPQNIRENIALFIGMCLFTALNYTGQRLVVFKKRKNVVKET
jgi:putative flippase GtrA